MEQANGLIVATFEHGTSRAQEPQLHTHSLVVNIATRFDGTTGTLIGKPLFNHKMVAGAIYRAELATELELALGVTIERKQNLFEISGVPKSLIEEFSTRRHQVLDAMKERGVHSARAAAAATMATRKVKEHIPRGLLFDSWYKIGASHSFTQEQAQGLLTKPRERENDPNVMKSLLTEVTEDISKQQSFFPENAFVRKLAEESPGRRFTAKDILTAARTHLDSSSEIIRLGSLDGKRFYSTPEILRIESLMLHQASQSTSKNDLSVSKSNIEKADKATQKHFGYELSAEQKAALTHITERAGKIQVVSGMAGTGKTAMLFAAREAWEREGFKVIGASLAGKAATGLEESSGIKSSTIAKLIKDLDAPRRVTMKDLRKKTFSGLKPMLKYAEKVTASRRAELPRLDKKTVLVIDEAGMVDTRQMAELVDRITKAGAKLVLVGDEKQLQPIEVGGAFRALGQRLGQAELTDIRRQKDKWASDAVHDMAHGRAASVLGEFAKRGLLTVADSRQAAMEFLISDWKLKGISRPEDALIICGTRLEAAALNQMAQAERRAARKIQGKSIQVGSESLHVGDRILFTKNSRMLGVNNGSTGTLMKIETSLLKTSKLYVKLDSGAVTAIDLKKYDSLQLGYAITTHKGQGMTVDNAFILAGGIMQDRELSYVQVSRAKLQTRIYTDRLEAGDQLTTLSEQMNRSRQKELAHELVQRDNFIPDHSQEHER